MVKKIIQKIKEKESYHQYLRLIIIVAISSFFFSLSFVPSASMVPTIQEKDFLLISRHSEVARGDMVIFSSPFGDGERYVKRVIAVGGDKISIKDGEVKINGEVLAEPYVNEPFESSIATMIVPEGELFVMGDNRNYSIDSREFGTIDESDVVGKMIAILLPFKRTEFGL